jgi:hypothetical protein
VSDEDIVATEEKLGVLFPAAYREFLASHGSGVVGPHEIYGLGGSPERSPHLLWLIADLKELRLIRPAQLIPFYAEGDGDYSAVLAAPLHGHRTGAVVYWSPRPDDTLDLRPAFDSFDEWYAHRVG